jgi:hypothetical protein
MLCHHGINDSVGGAALAKENGHKEDNLLVSGKSDTHPGDIRRVLASSHAPSHKKKKIKCK